MQTQVGIAFAWLLLGQESREKVKAHWKKFPPGRYLLPWEMARLLGFELKKTLKVESQIAMHTVWVDWCREENLSQDSLPFEHGEWFSWLDFANRNYREPMATARSEWEVA